MGKRRTTSALAGSSSSSPGPARSPSRSSPRKEVRSCNSAMNSRPQAWHHSRQGCCFRMQCTCRRLSRLYADNAGISGITSRCTSAHICFTWRIPCCFQQAKAVPLLSSASICCSCCSAAAAAAATTTCPQALWGWNREKDRQLMGSDETAIARLHPPADIAKVELVHNLAEPSDSGSRRHPARRGVSGAASYSLLLLRIFIGAAFLRTRPR